MAPEAKRNGNEPYDPNYEEQLKEQNIWLIRRPEKHELPQDHSKIMKLGAPKRMAMANATLASHKA